MTQELIIRGVPNRLSRDLWWLAEGPNTHDTRKRPVPRRLILATLGLVVVADLAFWQQEPGLSVALFCLVLSGAIVVLKPGGPARADWIFAGPVAVLGVLPVVEHANPLSISIAGTSVAIIFLRQILGHLPDDRHIAAFLTQFPTLGVLDLPRTLARLAADRGPAWSGIALATRFGLPTLLGGAFVALFITANPILATAMGQALTLDVGGPQDALRPVLWGLSAMLAWPLLRQRDEVVTPGATLATPKLPSALTGLLNPGSITLSLLLFNGLFLVQTLSDIGILFGGLSLPDGMTYADYAHRGAYPLLAAALLAGAFAMATHTLVRGERRLRWLVYAWMGQTLFLVVTAALRLSLYVEAYALTELRFWAFAWMGVVAIGLVLIIVQIARDHSRGWLLRANVALVATALYLACFVNAPHIIADVNLNADISIERLDLAYLCGLGEQVIPAMIDQGPVTDGVTCGRDGRPTIEFEPIESWQEWGFRRWRLQLYLDAHHDV